MERHWQDAEQLEHLVLADSTLVLAHNHELTVISDRRENEAASQHRAAMDGTPIGTPEHEAARLEFMRTMQDFRNQPGGFWVAANDPDAASEALIGSTPITDIQTVALLTDGATRLVDRFALLGWTELIDILAVRGPAELIRQTRAAEHSDPAGARWKRGKLTDDANIAYCTALSS